MSRAGWGKSMWLAYFCLQGAGSVARLVGEAGKSMKIVAAGNVTWENITDIVKRTGVTEVHSSARR